MIHLVNRRLFILLIKVRGETSRRCEFDFNVLASLKTVFVDKPENVLLLLKIIKQVPTLKRIILTKKLTDEKDLELRNKAKELNIEVFTYNQLRVCLFRTSSRKTLSVFLT